MLAGSLWPADGPWIVHAVLKWAQTDGQRRSRVRESPTVATLFAFGAGDGNRTRTISLGMETMPAWAHGGQGQSCPYLTVSARQGSFVDR